MLVPGGRAPELHPCYQGRERERITDTKDAHFALQETRLKPLRAVGSRQSGCGRLRGLQAAWRLSADGAGGGVVRTVAFSDCGLDTRAGKAGACTGGGGVSCLSPLTGHSFGDNQNDVLMKESWICSKSGGSLNNSQVDFS